MDVLVPDNHLSICVNQSSSSSCDTFCKIVLYCTIQHSCGMPKLRRSLESRSAPTLPLHRLHGGEEIESRSFARAGCPPFHILHFHCSTAAEMYFISRGNNKSSVLTLSMSTVISRPRGCPPRQDLGQASETAGTELSSPALNNPVHLLGPMFPSLPTWSGDRIRTTWSRGNQKKNILAGPINVPTHARIHSRR